MAEMIDKNYSDLLGKTVYINDKMTGEKSYYKIMDYKHGILYIQRIESKTPIEGADDIIWIGKNGLDIIGLMKV